MSDKVDDVKVLLERMDYNNRMRSFNSARLSRGDLPLLPLLDVNGHHVNIRWVREISDGTEQKILDWATRFGLEHGHGDDPEWRALHPFQTTNVQRKLLINYIGAY